LYQAGKVDRPITAREMVIVRPAVVVEMHVAERSLLKERLKVPVEPGMTAVECHLQPACGEFGEECGCTEMAALPPAHVLDTDPDPVLVLEPGKVIKRREQGGIGAIPYLLVGRLPGVYPEVVCTDAGAGCEHVAKHRQGRAPYTFVDCRNVDIACRGVDGIRKRVRAARGNIREEVVKSVTEDLDVRCATGKDAKRFIKRMVNAAKCRDV